MTVPEPDAKSLRILRRPGEEIRLEGGVVVRVVEITDNGAVLELDGSSPRPSRHEADVGITVRAPQPKVVLSRDEATKIAEEEAHRWVLRISPLSMVLRTVVRTTKLVPLRSSRTGAWAYACSGYSRSLRSRRWWTVHVDAATGRCLGIDDEGIEDVW